MYLDTDFELTDGRKKFIEKQIKTGEFYRNEEGVVLSKEYPENEANNNNSKFHLRKFFRDTERKNYVVIMDLCKKYYSHSKTVLEVGAGTGYFARMYINEFRPKKYVIYESSKPMVKRILDKFRTQKYKSSEINIKKKSFKDLSESKLSRYDCVISLEVFEHINWDREFLSKIGPGTWVFFSVPRIHAISHVRAFLTHGSIVHRYKDILDIKEIREVKKFNKETGDYPLKWAVASQRKV